ncbi:uncharacterized protein LOC108090585 [Drosophila ficusphila]|uniref:uncharacterized protein LOC108090585 n=1 Tax=Drosophila ficusphila TaxID=30025 RepID=UPI0007E8081D|nr:uncharacterized protein LOC108090585 [Drosophila ficusphila]
MDHPFGQRHKSKKISTIKQNLSEALEAKRDAVQAEDQPIVYDYMKYPSYKAKNKLAKFGKARKRVSFKTMVELVTFTDNWKMKTSESKLRTEEEQVKCSLKRRNF